MGRSDEALAHFRAAVELDPRFAQAHTNLGQLLVELGRAAEALPHCEQAARLAPDMPALHHNLGNTLRALERWVDARMAYLEALRLAPGLAIAHAHLGLVLKGEGQAASAVIWLKRAVELEPDNGDCWEFLAQLYDELEEAAPAIACWQRVLILNGPRAGPNLSLGWALQEEGRLVEARQQYELALKLAPQWAPAHLNLGGLDEEEGNFARAKAGFRTALELQPAFALPHARLAVLLRGKLPEADLARLEERLADEQLIPAARARLLFGLAHVLDARGDYSGAAQCLRQANAVSLETNRGRRDYDPADHERFVDGLLAMFDRDLFARLAPAGSDSPRPVFVFGLPRSGTTLVEQILASHPRIHGAGELRMGRNVFESLPATVQLSGTPLDCLRLLNSRNVSQLADRYLDRLNAIDFKSADRIGDKMPDNYLYLGLLAILFPKATFLHCRRDLRDIAVSCWMTDFRSIRWANSETHIASRFQQYARLMKHWRATLPLTVHDVRSEETVENLESVARRIVAACGLEWEPACVRFHETQRPIRTASVSQVRQPVYRRSLARWKHYAEELPELLDSISQAIESDDQPDAGGGRHLRPQ